MHIPRRHVGAEKRGFRLERIVPCYPLDPNLVHRIRLPVREQAHTVAARPDFIEMIVQRGHREIQVDMLDHVEGGLKVQRNFRNHAEAAEAHDRSGESFAVLLAGEGDQIAVRIDERDCSNRRGQISVRHARAVGGRSTGPRHGNVRQGSQIVQGIPSLLEIGSKIAVAHAGPHRHPVRLLVEMHHLIEMLKGYLRVDAVRNGVEAMTRTERSDPGRVPHEVLRLGNRCGRCNRSVE